jgi:hypothetical protein
MVAFTSGVVLSATHGPLRQTKTLTTSVVTLSTRTQVNLSTITSTQTTTVISTPRINVTTLTVGVVQIAGEGFRPQDNITITFDGVEMKSQPPLVQSDSNGRFFATAYVPSYAKPGTHVITASDSGHNSASQLYSTS